MNTIPLSAAKAGFSKIIDEISKSHTVYQITRDGIPRGVILSVEEYDSMVETLEILSDPELMSGIRRSISEAKKGKFLTHGEVFE